VRCPAQLEGSSGWRRRRSVRPATWLSGPTDALRPRTSTPAARSLHDVRPPVAELHEDVGERLAAWREQWSLYGQSTAPRDATEVTLSPTRRRTSAGAAGPSRVEIQGVQRALVGVVGQDKRPGVLGTCHFSPEPGSRRRISHQLELPAQCCHIGGESLDLGPADGPFSMAETRPRVMTSVSATAVCVISALA
jgi:hypothetical protein